DAPSPLQRGTAQRPVRGFRRRLRRPHRRGRRLLRRGAARRAQRRRATRPAAGLCGFALVQAVLSLRRLPLAHRRPDRADPRGAPTEPTPPAARWHGRNRNWKELHNADVLLMPDTWEYPWYASWDLAFHCVAMAHIDPGCAKDQLRRMGHEWYQHASGQFPAYEWDFDDVNPPLLGWAAWLVYRMEREQTETGDIAFLKEAFPNEVLHFS